VLLKTAGENELPGDDDGRTLLGVRRARRVRDGEFETDGARKLIVTDWRDQFT